MKIFIIYVILLISPSILIAANDIDSNNKYAWAENIGWLQLSGDTWKVNHDGQGNLSGYAWNQNFGWVMFKSDYSQVKINLETGEFYGDAGWISFNGES